MSWPELEKNVKGFDLSQYQGKINFQQLRALNPDVPFVIIRACATSYIDSEWEDNWAESGEYLRAPYVNNDPTWKVNGPQGEMWKRALGNFSYPLIVYDCESSFGRSPQVITADIREGLDFLRTNWPSARVIIYTAEWFWKPKIIHGWEEDEEVWTAQYPYMIEWRVVHSFAEMDPFLPIHNSFTPRTPMGFKKENVKGWQFTHKGIVRPIAKSNLLPRTDLNYFLKEWVEEIFDEMPPPTGPNDPVPLKLTFPKGDIDVTIEEV